MIVIPTAPWAHGMFDVLAWTSGGALGVAAHRWRLKAATERLAGAVGPGYFAALAAGAAPGAWLSGSLNTMQGTTAFLSHSIVGAMAGAIIGVEIYKALRGVRGSTGGMFVGSFALGCAVGRWGCLFAGLPDFTYGTPTTLPWAVDLGDGVGRHPVQVYESLCMAGFLAAWLWGLKARASWAMRRGFYALCVCYGLQRFAWEFLKPYPRLLGPFNVFHILCAGLVTYGVVFYTLDLARERRGGPALSRA